MVGRRTIALFVATSLLFGGTFVATKAGLDYFPPLLFVALRYDVATVAIALYAAYAVPRRQLLPRTAGDVASILATGVFAIGLTNALLFVGQQYTTSAVGSIMFSLNPILTPVFAGLLLADERLSSREASGMALALLGVVLVVNPDPGNLTGGLVGKSILFAGAVSGALGSVLVRRADSSLSSTARTAWALPIAAVLTHGLSWWRGESAANVVWTSEALLALAYVGLFAGAVAYVAYFGLIDETGAIRANLAFYVVPVVASLGGWALLGETISTLAIAGFLTILTGFVVLGSDSIDVRDTVPFLGGQNRKEPATSVREHSKKPGQS
ncbi:DMT family transporter [Halospeciosus flavus]|uniref:DMT family transporter n=1 Tax=Halospeciosus flavus TaxID=3032283 RepID=A0ABD5YW32_9EURY